eukprot:6508932-Pyramimonas_sp.AAC.1
MSLTTICPECDCSWEPPYPVWETPSVPAVPSGVADVGLKEERRGVHSDTSGGIVIAFDSLGGEEDLDATRGATHHLGAPLRRLGLFDA